MRDFLKAIRHIDSNFYDKYMDQLIEDRQFGKKDQLDGYIIAQLFQTKYRESKQSGNQPTHRGQAFATLQGQDPPPADGQGQGSSRPCLCGSTSHFFFRDCHLVNKKKTGPTVDKQHTDHFQEVILRAGPTSKAFTRAD